VHAPISVVRMAVDDAYGAEEWREGEGIEEIAYRTEKITRRVCRGVAEFAFIQARKMRAEVFGGPKYTVSPVYEGMFKEEMDRAAELNKDVRYNPQLVDATFALLLATHGNPMVIPTLNRDGDLMSDMVLQMFGSIAGAESLLIALDEDENPQTVMAEAPHGTAPSLEGKNIANPMAMILAGAALLTFFHDEAADRASRAIYESTLESVLEGNRTVDLGGSVGTT
jgi:isocitrate dehydrogenase (NAD+)